MAPFCSLEEQSIKVHQEHSSIQSYQLLIRSIQPNPIPLRSSLVFIQPPTPNAKMPTFTVFKGNDTGFPKKSTTTKPDELKSDFVLVRVTASGVCGTGKWLTSTLLASSAKC